MILDIWNEKALEIEIVLADSIPKQLKSESRRVVAVDRVNLADAIEYHNECKNESVKRVLCSEAQISYDLIETLSKYCLPVFDLDEKRLDLVVDKSSRYKKLFYIINWYIKTNNDSILALGARRALGCDKLDINQYFDLVRKYTTQSMAELQRRYSDYVCAYVKNTVIDSVELTESESERHNHFTCSSLDMGYSSISCFSSGTMSSKIIKVLKSPAGSGKTIKAIEFAKQLNSSDKKVVFFTNLRAVVKNNQQVMGNLPSSQLENQTNEKVKYCTYQSELHEIENAQTLFATINSIEKLRIREFVRKADFIVIDEIESLLKNIFAFKQNHLSSELRQVVQNFVRELIEGETPILFMDADVSNFSRDFILSCLPPSKKLETIEVFPSIFCPRSTKNISASIHGSFDMHSYLTKQKLIGKENFFIASDSVTRINNMLIDSGYSDPKGSVADYGAALDNGILVIVADERLRNVKYSSTYKKSREDFLASPNTSIKEYRTVIVSPILQEGFSITAEFSQDVFILSSNVLEPESLIQLARRLRSAKHLNFGVSENFNQNIQKTPKRYIQSFEDTMFVQRARQSDILLKYLPVTLKVMLEMKNYSFVDQGSRIGINDYDSSKMVKINNADNIFELEVKKALLNGKTESISSHLNHRLKGDAVRILRDILKLNTGAMIKIAKKQQYFNGCVALVDSVVDQLIEHLDVLSSILPGQIIKKLQRKEPFTSTAKTQLLNSLYFGLGYNKPSENKNASRVLKFEKMTA
ncbi:MAG: hypothetical protein COA76_11985 [Moritella sp.]|nr:MAG: hypothetical protein COA76_11985 [Moritella sp.]